MSPAVGQPMLDWGMKGMRNLPAFQGEIDRMLQTRRAENPWLRNFGTCFAHCSTLATCVCHGNLSPSRCEGKSAATVGCNNPNAIASGALRNG
ncbi:hypothetical protein Poly24_26340 [Rosistilla carotiformis]|uniref:Uncharacterized protein n=1 Tax=Rosistilla carotiformis TaxID=2528017 RepID=A0A518JTP2_9BACT|nr:hypothetical protein Poly24_26340 [Rosistilla carotiformis]